MCRGEARVIRSGGCFNTRQLEPKGSLGIVDQKLILNSCPETRQNREKAKEEEENRGKKEAWNYNNLIIGTLNTKPKDEKNALECQKTTARHGKTQGKLDLNMVHFWTCCQHDLSALKWG
ncbi:hypothetical protein PIB30_071994 [Stylosanthes scabra]|uniref:Uncharacterized protein n=1 Tax=Stylosanthes scabra TaxID=79078 RepID=A0ABU6XQ57_9FABA|nr:hypothetical protein [Stylosanthes scabra]